MTTEHRDALAERLAHLLTTALAGPNPERAGELLRAAVLDEDPAERGPLLIAVAVHAAARTLGVLQGVEHREGVPLADLLTATAPGAH